MCRTFLFCSPVGLLILTACSTIPQDAAVWDGRFSSGFEVSRFEPCGRDEAWWVSDATGALLQRYRSVTDSSYQVAFARLSGEVGPLGSFGHMGMYDREFTVMNIVEIRILETEDCR